MEGVLNHFCHEHPLILTENVEANLRCYGCKKPVTSELAYICANQCGSTSMILHKNCGELPRQISVPSHSDEHPLHLFDYEYFENYFCDICEEPLDQNIGYRCFSCDFDIDISCQQLITGLLQEKTMQHPSHKYHVLKLIRKPASLFYCDGCGSEDRGMAYACTTCEFFIHEACATLPLTLATDRHHHHLSLAFDFPVKHRRFKYKCDICRKDFHSSVYWVYYCGDCRFFAHLKCATSENVAESSSLNSSEGSGADLIELPVDDISKELITPFIMRENGEIPDVDAMPSLITPAMEFNYHNHPLRLVREELDEDKSDEDGVKICDVCVSHISSPPYYKCTSTTTCTAYFLHSICYFLPKTLSRPANKLYGFCESKRENHIFRLYTRLEKTRCRLCELRTNGMVYICEVGGCGMCIDVKCASLPTTLKHSSHPHHNMIIKSSSDVLTCGASGCTFFSYRDIAYCCTSCDFALHLWCALQPRSVRDKRWDKNHSLVWTFNAALDHPTDFYCESCEKEMHPKEWMYHCPACDNSFHPRCLTASGEYRNIKFGHQFEIEHFHPHPLTYNVVTLKLRCDICKKECYRAPGVECELCNYVACRPCALELVRISSSLTNFLNRLNQFTF